MFDYFTQHSGRSSFSLDLIQSRTFKAALLLTIRCILTAELLIKSLVNAYSQICSGQLLFSALRWAPPAAPLGAYTYGPAARGFFVLSQFEPRGPHLPKSEHQLFNHVVLFSLPPART